MGEWADTWASLLPGRDPSDPTVARRVDQGVAFQRTGRVGELRVRSGFAVAQVQGSRATPYAVEVEVVPFTDDEWERLIEVLATTQRHHAALLAGLAPQGLIEDAAEVGVALFPAPADIDVLCPCGQNQPCPHVAGMWEATAVALEDDPFAYLQLRGRGRERLLAEIGARRRRGRADDATVSLDDLDGDDWTHTQGSMRDLADAIEGGRREAHAPVLALLGDPPGWPGGAPPAHEAFAPLVERAAQRLEDRLARPKGGDADDDSGGTING